MDYEDLRKDMNSDMLKTLRRGTLAALESKDVAYVKNVPYGVERGLTEIVDRYTHDLEEEDRKLVHSAGEAQKSRYVEAMNSALSRPDVSPLDQSAFAAGLLGTGVGALYQAFGDGDYFTGVVMGFSLATVLEITLKPLATVWTRYIRGSKKEKVEAMHNSYIL